MYRKIRVTVATTACVAIVAAAALAAERPEIGAGEPTLATVRAATERFMDVKVAQAKGYMVDPGNICEVASMIGRSDSEGAMGIHYFRPDLLGITAPPNPRMDGVGTHTDLANPGVLIYEPQADGTLELVAVENLVFKTAWEAAGHTEPPSYYGAPYDLMQDDPATGPDEGHMFALHYDRHLWVLRINPNGVFAQFNPEATCAHHLGGTHGHGG
jgi:hypothetical protein